MADDGEERFDPFAVWRDAMAAYEKQLADALQRGSSTEGASDLMARYLDGYLNVARAARENIAGYLQAANLPTRADIAALGARIDELSNRLEDLFDELRTVRKAVEKRKLRKKP